MKSNIARIALFLAIWGALLAVYLIIIDGELDTYHMLKLITVFALSQILTINLTIMATVAVIKEKTEGGDV